MTSSWCSLKHSRPLSQITTTPGLETLRGLQEWGGKVPSAVEDCPHCAAGGFGREGSQSRKTPKTGQDNLWRAARDSVIFLFPFLFMNVVLRLSETRLRHLPEARFGRKSHISPNYIYLAPLV